MQIKTTMRYYLTPVRTVIIKKKQITKAGEDVEKREPSHHYLWECKLIQPLWKTVRKFLKKLKTELPYDLGIPLLAIYSIPPKKTKNNNTKRYMHTNVHRNIIYNCQDMEATKASINR